MPRDPLDVLGLDAESASPERIKERYRELSKVHHPDMSGGSADKMAELSDAVRAALVGAHTAVCDACAGSGKIAITRGTVTLRMTCPKCKGSRRKWR